MVNAIGSKLSPISRQSNQIKKKNLFWVVLYDQIETEDQIGPITFTIHKLLMNERIKENSHLFDDIQIVLSGAK